MVLNYFGVKENEVVILEVNNQEERKYLEGVATEAQLGTRTYSCAYVQPTSKGNGLNVKTVNLTYVTSSMIASTLTTCGITDANVIAMTPLSGGVSGTGALTGIMKAFEDATGKPLDEEKKEVNVSGNTKEKEYIAQEEIVVYETNKGNVKAYTLSKGDKVKLRSLYSYEQDKYIKVVDEEGRYGWIKLEDNQILE